MVVQLSSVVAQAEEKKGVVVAAISPHIPNPDAIAVAGSRRRTAGGTPPAGVAGRGGDLGDELAIDREEELDEVVGADSEEVVLISWPRGSAIVVADGTSTMMPC